MKTHFLTGPLFLLVAALGIQGQTPTGAVAGIVRDQAKNPLPRAIVTVSNLDDKTTKSVTADDHGAYVISDVKPGKYSVAADAVGFTDGTVASLEVAPGQTALADLSLVAKAGGPPVNVVTGGFWKRFGKAYWDDWHPQASAANAPPAPFRGDPAPVENPPFPFIVWPMGGTPYIGYPNATQYPLTTALQTGPHGEWWKKANIQMYGWVDLGMNISTSHNGVYANAPAAYAAVANSFILDQATFYIERTPDTVQTDHFDWGFRLTNLYGFDYRYTTAMGYFSQQLLNNPKANGTIGNKYGYDPVMAYLDLYFPHVGNGMDVRIGRYISLPDIEAQLAPNNYTYSHSLTYTYDCYTQTGVNATIKLTNHWTIQGGISGGCEAAPWAPDAKLTGNVCAAYMWNQARDNFYVCANSINDSKYNYNNLAAYYATWYHKFGHSPWHFAWETWYQYMKDTPNVRNPDAASLLITNSNGAYCKNATDLTCFAPEWSSVFYLTEQIGKKDALIYRYEYFDDIKGQRTGFNTAYHEAEISWNHWIGSTIVFRPELRWEHALNLPAYDSGLKKTQLMFAGDMIFFF
jgi:hypothetical protein